jgi:N-acetylglucosaminyl-diphospho-decaprenol L-rhamnosyltransferase
MIITCVILNYNDSETTVSLINKIKRYSIINHIIIVDNCSTDKSFEHLNEYSSDTITVLSTPKNGGYGYGNNYGLLYSYHELEADYTLIVNPDVEFEENIIYSLLNLMKENNNCAITSCKPINKDKKMDYARKYTSGLQDVLSASLIVNKFIGARYYEEEYFQNKDFCQVYEVPGSLLLVKTAWMVQHGLYDEDIFLYEEEKILAHKMAQNNLKTILSLKDEYIHNHSVSISKTYKSNVSRKKILLNSKYIFLKKYKKFNKFQLLLTKIFFRLSIVEMYIYSIYKDLQKH